MPRIRFHAHVRCRHDIVHHLRGQALVVEILDVPELTASAIEEMVKWGKDRLEDGVVVGRANSNVVVRAVSGQQPLSEDNLDFFEYHFPALRRLRGLLLWSWLRQCKLTDEKWECAHRSLDDESFWLVHRSVTGLHDRKHAYWIGPQQIHEDALACLVLTGTMDGIWTLCLLYDEAMRFDEDNATAMRIARYVPPALAFYGRRTKRRLRLAICMFAYMRKHFLDCVCKDGRALDLSSYDLVATAASTMPWADKYRETVVLSVNHPDAHPSLGDEAKRWIERTLAPIKTLNHPMPEPRWAPRYGPGCWLLKLETDLHPLCRKAMSVLMEALGRDYWPHYQREGMLLKRSRRMPYRPQTTRRRKSHISPIT